jgi:hypothetical protein
MNDGKVDECSSDEDSIFDDYTQLVPTEHIQLETLTLKMVMNQELICIDE